MLYDIWGWVDKEAGDEGVGIESERYDVDSDGQVVSFNFDSSYSSILSCASRLGASA